QHLVRARVALGQEPEFAPEAVVPPLPLHAGDVAPEVDVRRQLPLRRCGAGPLRNLARIGKLVHVARTAVGTGEQERHLTRYAEWRPGIQSVPASGNRAIAAASTVRATRSSGSRL